MAYITPITQEKDAAIETTIVEVETVAEREGRHGAQEEEKEEAERRQGRRTRATRGTLRDVPAHVSS